MALELASKNVLKRVSIEPLPARHPIKILDQIYAQLARGVEGNQLPDLEDIIDLCPATLPDYWLLLEPVTAESFIDFIVRQKGSNIPGVISSKIETGERYSHYIKQALIDERLMELASSLVLKQPRYSEAKSARTKALNVRVYRGVFPVWQIARKKSAAILIIAQPYVELPPE